MSCSVDAKSQLTQFEQLPNELMLDIFSRIEIEYLHDAFWGLNLRFNVLFQSTKRLSFKFHDYIKDQRIKLYGSFVNELVIDTFKSCDLQLFPNVKKLTILNTDSNDLNKINPEILPSLTHLTISLGSTFTAPTQLIQDIFSNKFPSIEYANLGQLARYDSYLWLIVPSLRFISVGLTRVHVMSDILMTCPNLNHLQLHILETTQTDSIPTSPITYPLRRLTIWSDTRQLTLNTINSYLSIVPNVQHLYLQTVYKASLVKLADNLIHKLKDLSRFDCHIKINTFIDDTDDILNSLSQVHTCFTRIKCIEQDEEEKQYRFFFVQINLFRDKNKPRLILIKI